VWRSDRIVILEDTKAAVCLIRRPSSFSNNTFSGFIENVQTDTHTHTHKKDLIYFTKHIARTRGEFRPRQTRQLPRVVDLKGRLLSCQSY